MYKLMSTFEKLIKKLNERNNKPQHVVVKYNYSQEGQREYLMQELQAKKKAAFEAIFAVCETRIHAIFTFLALLELIQQKYMTLLTGTGRNNFIVEWNENRAEDIGANDTLAAETPEE